MGTNPKYVLVLDLQSRPLFLGREKRLANADQRIALYSAERGCTAPGCDAPATRCQVHHISEWTDGGKTDITGLTLACDRHHGKVVPTTHDARRGWHTITVPSGPYTGRTGWRRTADPHGKHRVNHRHHTDELFRQALEHWHQRRAQFTHQWHMEDLDSRYRAAVGTTYADIAAILDSPNGPPILEQLLAEHDSENDWCAEQPVGVAA